MIIFNFPDKACQSLDELSQNAYYVTHYEHVKSYLGYFGHIRLIDADTTIATDRHNNNFTVALHGKGKKIIFDYSDFYYNVLDMNLVDSRTPYFKFHTTKNTNPRCIAFPPMSFTDWDDYHYLKGSISYNPQGSIFYKCRIYGGATERRTQVLDMLKDYSGVPVDFTFVIQSNYFASMNDCRINVIVPGARNDILDRTHLQSFAYGIPVITPYISTILPFGMQFEPNVDYIECASDFSDVIELIDRYKDNKEYLDFISNNCKNKFSKTCSLEAVQRWVLQHI
jgi:hypothetical protein